MLILEKSEQKIKVGQKPSLEIRLSPFADKNCNSKLHCFVCIVSLELQPFYIVRHPVSCDILKVIFEMFRRSVGRLCSLIGNQNFQTKKNIMTDGMPCHTVYVGA